MKNPAKNDGVPCYPLTILDRQHSILSIGYLSHFTHLKPICSRQISSLQAKNPLYNDAQVQKSSGENYV